MAVSFPAKGMALPAVVHEMFSQYDVGRKGELELYEVQALHERLRMGGISLPQVQAAMEYACAVPDACMEGELYDLLQEMDRRYFLVQDLRWEFSLLDTNDTDTITEDQAKWFIQCVHGEHFSVRNWNLCLKKRAVLGSGVSFSEIEVELCNIPSAQALALEEEAAKKREIKRQQQLKAMKEEEARLREEAARAEKKRREEERRKREAEEERERKKKLEEERRQAKELKEKLRKDREEREQQEELERLEKEKVRLAEMKKNNEANRKKEAEEAESWEKSLKEAEEEEKTASEEERKAAEDVQKALDAQSKKDAEDRARKAEDKKKNAKEKRIRSNLKVAIKERKRPRLQTSSGDFRKEKLHDYDEDLPKADRLIKFCDVRDGLAAAMRNRSIPELEGAMQAVRKAEFEPDLQAEMVEANLLLIRLRRLERIRAEILELKQSTVAEIRSYQKPPQAVHLVMTAVFLVLGHKKKETEIWRNVQALVGKTGKEGLKRRCLEFDPSSLPVGLAVQAQSVMKGLVLDDIREVSAGAATFFLWANNIIEEVTSS